MRSNQLKEFVVLKNNKAQTDYSFRVSGASLSPDKDNPGSFKLNGALSKNFEVAPLSVTLMQRGVISQTVTTQTFANGQLSVHVDANWLHNLPTANFPVVIDPTFTSRINNNYFSFKSDGYACNPSNCFPEAGSLNDAGKWKWWRSTVYTPYTQLQGRTLLNATFHLQQMPATSGRFYGYYNANVYSVWHAGCLGFNCIDSSLQHESLYMNTSGNFNVTEIYWGLMARGDWGGWMLLTGPEGGVSSLKMFDPNNSYTTFTYEITPPPPTITTPTAGQTLTDPQVSFKTNTVINPNGSQWPLLYDFRVSTGSDGQTGTVVDSGYQSSTQWTIPDGILQDGNTYYVTAYTNDGYNISPPSAIVPFKIDSRKGKDKTQTYDTLGPVSVDLATGNLSTSASSHTSKALGGNLGVGLDYNSPVASRKGLVASYWNLPTNGTGIPATPPDLQRVDQNVDFAWQSGSPGSPVNKEWFAAQWNGYFVAPTTGTYYFGAVNDDWMGITVNGQQVYNNGDCYGGAPCYGSSIDLTAGQVASFQASYNQGPGGDLAHLYVKGPVAEQVVPQTWFQTGVRPIADSHGLIGHYYNDDGSHNMPSDPSRAFLTRTDPLISLNWGLGGPLPNGPADNFIIRWTGYFTAPTTGSYQFGTGSDDGSRVTVNGQQVYSKWYDDGGGEGFGSGINLTAGQSVPITVDYYEHNLGALMYLEVQGAVTKQIVPSAWLSTKAQVLPAGWNLGLDPDGNASYDHLAANQNNVVLYDSSGDTHAYSWTGSGYKPPVNEDGQLTRNNDGSFSFIDTDGQTYVFNADGTLQSLTSAVDDRKPAALQYTYSGSPAKLTQISDGVDPSRNASLYYSGDSHCTTAPAGFDSSAPANMLCAVQTNDGRTTSFYYLNGLLARIVAPGNDTTDYQYDTLGRIVAMRDALANDAVNAGVRSADNTTLTQISYDALGRATSVTAPAATASATRIQNTPTGA